MSANAAASEPDTLGPPHPVAESHGRRHLYEVDIVRLQVGRGLNAPVAWF